MYFINKILRANGYSIIDDQYYHWTSNELNINNATRWDGYTFSQNFKNVSSRFLGIKKF